MTSAFFCEALFTGIFFKTMSRGVNYIYRAIFGVYIIPLFF